MRLTVHIKKTVHISSHVSEKSEEKNIKQWFVISLPVNRDLLLPVAVTISKNSWTQVFTIVSYEVWYHLYNKHSFQ